MARLLNLFDAFGLDSALAGLSMSDRVRLAEILDVLRAAPDGVRMKAQRELQSLLRSKPGSYEECTAALDAILERASRKRAGAGPGVASDARRV